MILRVCAAETEPTHPWLHKVAGRISDSDTAHTISVSLHINFDWGVFMKENVPIYFEELPQEVQEIIIELIVSIIENKRKKTEEE
jgi:hypothetical protein